MWKRRFERIIIPSGVKSLVIGVLIKRRWSFDRNSYGCRREESQLKFSGRRRLTIRSHCCGPFNGKLKAVLDLGNRVSSFVTDGKVIRLPPDRNYMHLLANAKDVIDIEDLLRPHQEFLSLNLLQVKTRKRKRVMGMKNSFSRSTMILRINLILYSQRTV